MQAKLYISMTFLYFKVLILWILHSLSNTKRTWLFMRTVHGGPFHKGSFVHT